jgi:hypothetical protein
MSYFTPKNFLNNLILIDLCREDTDDAIVDGDFIIHRIQMITGTSEREKDWYNGNWRDSLEFTGMILYFWFTKDIDTDTDTDTFMPYFLGGLHDGWNNAMGTICKCHYSRYNRGNKNAYDNGLNIGSWLFNNYKIIQEKHEQET